MKNVLTGASWVLIGYGFSQLIRLGSNLALTRLLFPDMFGVMTLVSTFMNGLQMLSDVGIGPSIIHNRRGDDPTFLNTAWTIQIVRGFALWACSCLLAWPYAAVYGIPDLCWIIPTVGLTAVMSGFTSTAFYTHARHISLGRITAIELASLTSATAAMIGLALVYKSLWVLVAGSLIGAAVKTVLSHLVLIGASNRFRWEQEAAAELFRFGRWVFVSTCVTYLWVHADKFLLGYFMSSEEFGVYAVAFVLAQFVPILINTLAEKVIFPLYARLEESGKDELRDRIEHLRAKLLLLTLPFVCATAILAPRIIDFMYDARYREAGWILRILTIGSIVQICTATLSPLVLAKGESRRHTMLMISRLLLTVSAMLVGGVLAGASGMVVGYALAPLLFYPVLVHAALRPYRVWTPRLDLCAVLLSIGIVLLGVWSVG